MVLDEPQPPDESGEPTHQVWPRRRCPECNSDHIHANTTRDARQTQYRCMDCGHCWQVVWED